MTCPHCEEEMTFMDDWDVFYECENQDCPYLESVGEAFFKLWTAEDEALEKADLYADLQKEETL